MLLNEQEKHIYNAHLIASKVAKGLPFKIKKNFTNINDTTYLTLKKLGSFFKHNNNINLNDFFSAPYLYYGKDDYFDLQFFTTTKAVKCYTLYLKKRETEDPDNSSMINSCKECCLFIYKFCRENNITLCEYKNLINGTTPIALQHLREHKINFYTLHGLDINNTIRKVESDLLDFFVQDFYSLLNTTRVNFLKSTRLKTIIREALSIIEIKLLKNKSNSL